jgi:hypothetical protein
MGINSGGTTYEKRRYNSADCAAGYVGAGGPKRRGRRGRGHRSAQSLGFRARSRYGANVRIVAATDVAGYCAIAVGRQPNGNVQLGIALGHSSAADAERVAIEQCLKAGGINPKVRWRFRG